MRMYDLIRHKRDGGEHSDSEIEFIIKGYTKGEIPDYQMSAWAMAVFYSGMTDKEIVTLTREMTTSGDTVDLSRFGNMTVDKHSTGGVGDKTTLAVAPIVASLGCYTAKMTGRGLGHTGGTIDKLESIPGYRISLTNEEFLNQVERIGIAVIGQSASLAPADKKLYALRDVTATVDSIPLIASSIMSKKLAAGAHNIVLDVKMGSGAFMKTVEEAERLSEKMVSIGNSCGRNTAAFITDMDRPLGYAVGNSLEVIEAVNTLKNPQKSEFLTLCINISSKIISLAHGCDFEAAMSQVQNVINSGKAYETMLKWISAQGGDIAYLENTSLFPATPVKRKVYAPQSGYIHSMDTEGIGIASVMLGGGRKTITDSIDYGAGIVIHTKNGDFVSAGDVIATLYSSSETMADDGEKKYLDSVTISGEKPIVAPLIYKSI